MEDSKAFSQSRKRPLENDIQNSSYYKMRAVIKDLRPHFIEVLKTPDFRNCKAADDIREGMKRLMDLYGEMTAESIKLQKCSNGSIHNGQKLVEDQEDVKPAQDDLASAEPWDTHIQGTYIVGGSAFGWNFITFRGTESVYYGRTKDDFRAKNAGNTDWN